MTETTTTPTSTPAPPAWWCDWWKRIAARSLVSFAVEAHAARERTPGFEILTEASNAAHADLDRMSDALGAPALGVIDEQGRACLTFGSPATPQTIAAALGRAPALRALFAARGFYVYPISKA